MLDSCDADASTVAASTTCCRLATQTGLHTGLPRRGAAQGLLEEKGRWCRVYIVREQSEKGLSRSLCQVDQSDQDLDPKFPNFGSEERRGQMRSEGVFCLA